MNKLPLLFTGIDPGASGGVSSLLASGEIYKISKLKYDREYILELIQDINRLPFRHRIAIEKVGGFIQGWVPNSRNKLVSMNIAAATHMFNFGKGVGWLEMAIESQNMSSLNILPATWMRGLGIEPKSRKENKQAFKNRLKTKAIELFPEKKKIINLSICDSLLIAEYYRQTYVRS